MEHKIPIILGKPSHLFLLHGLGGGDHFSLKKFQHQCHEVLVCNDNDDDDDDDNDPGTPTGGDETQQVDDAVP